MIGRSILVACIIAASATPALAFHCPQDMAAIDAALAKNPSLSQQQMSEVKSLREKGEEHHKAGKHQDSVDSLAKAKAILGLK